MSDTARKSEETEKLSKAMKLLSLILLTLFCSSGFAQEGQNLELSHLDEIDKQVIPADTSVRTGVLKNGLTYYVRRCTSPEKKAAFWLLVKGGSVIEQDNERGLAHYVEHMMFRGTKHFPSTRKKGGDEAGGQGGVIGFMRRNGIPFGHDSNAFTGLNTVRYFLNGIPTEDTEQMDSCLLLLRDWAGDATITDEDVEHERGVIVEEWRMKQTVSFGQQMINDLFSNSIYTQRMTIGDMEVVRNCTPKLIRNFYKRWYQPQNQAVVVTGDFDPDAMVEKIKKTFGNLKRGKNVVPAQPIIPDHEKPHIRFYQDQRISAHSSCILIRLPNEQTVEKNTVGALRTKIIRDRIKNVMRERLSTLRNKDIHGITVSYLDLADVKDSKNLVLEMSSTADTWQQTLEMLLKSIEYARRKGFKDSEIDTTKCFVRYNADSTAIDLPDTLGSSHNHSSKDWAEKFVNNFFNDAVINDERSERMCESYIHNTLTTDQLNEEFRKITSGRNMLVAEMFPEGVTLPTEDEVNAVIERVRQMADEELAAVDIKVGKKLEWLHVDSLNLDPVPGTVKQTTVRNDSITELMLSNGVKVLLWRSPLKEAKYCIDMKFGRPYGCAALSDEDFHYQMLLHNCRRKFSHEDGGSGVEFTDFYDRMDFGAFLTDFSKEFWKGVEQRLKAMHASLTTTEVDSVEAGEKISEIRTMAVTFNEPMGKAVRRIQRLPFVTSRRGDIPTVEEAATYSVEGFCELVKDYFSNFNGSVLIVKGLFPNDSIMPLVLKYIGSLPSKAEPVKRPLWASHHLRDADTTVVEKITNVTPYCATYLFYTWEKGFQFTQESHAHNQVLQSVLQSIVLNTLRIQQSDVYSPTCVVTDKQLPFDCMMCCISFTCDPTQRERIVQNVNKLLHDMANANLITQELIDSYVKEREKKAKDTNWGSRYYDLTRELGDIVIDDSDTSYIKRVTPASLKAHLNRLLKKGHLQIGYLTTE